MTPQWESTADVVVIGTGVSGVTTAIDVTALGLRVLVITKAEADAGNTRWAQGGIAAVLPGTAGPADRDSVAGHVSDTLTAGGGVCVPEVAQAVASCGAGAVYRLASLGAVFDTDPTGQLAVAREGGHSAFRIVHAGGDATGAEIERALLAAARNRRIPVMTGHVAVDAVRTPTGAVAGVLVLDTHGILGLVRASAVVLATGGLGQLYTATSNPEVATGDGVALALRAGASVTDMEFVQFHPTVLYTGPGARGRSPLITEALRGAGAVLVDATGARVMTGVHPLEDLAPRDVVAAAVTGRLAEKPGGVDDHVFLDATHLDADLLRRRFPTVLALCWQAGLDPAVDAIPVRPAAHYACGGVSTTLDGRTGVTGLYAVGEVARTGLHGANRLASNSLLEGLVVGARAARAIADDMTAQILADHATTITAPDPLAPSMSRDTLQQVMTWYAGIGRTADGLAAATALLNTSTVDRPVVTRTDVEDAALTLVARTLLTAAAARTETRGCHVRTDFPDTLAAWQRSLSLRLDATGELVISGESAPTARSAA